MSNIYIQEPPTNGKVILKTTLGDIEIELWSRETPKACRNFIQLCMEGYYNGTIFHRVIRDFIAQGGDPTGTGEDGESIYGEPFKDEFHSRLRFNRRGLLAMANAEPDDNGSQFFFTLGPTPELQKKHTIFGKVAGNTIYNMLKLNDCEVIDERPVRAERIISAEIVHNPFSDIKPRNLIASNKSKDEDKDKEKTKKKGVKNFSLLSFGEEAEEEETELETVSQKLKAKGKSAHDIGDPSLSSRKVIEDEYKQAISRSDSSSEDEHLSHKKRKHDDQEKQIESIKTKLEKKKHEIEELSSKVKAEPIENHKKLSAKEQQIQQTKEEIKRLQKEILDNKKKSIEEEDKRKNKAKEEKEEIEIVKKYKEDVDKYEHLKNKKLKAAKEDKTLELLNSFRERLFKAKQTTINHLEKDREEEKPRKSQENENEDKVEEDELKPDALKSIFVHKLELTDEIKQKVIDANVADHERYDIYDPRNPLNKRKREESRHAMKEKKSSHLASSSASKYSL